MNSPQQNFADNQCSKNPVSFHNEGFLFPPTLGRAFEAISHICSAFQYDYFLIATAPSFKDQIRMENIVLTNLPSFLTNEFVTMDEAGDWSVLFGIENTLAPFCWHKDRGLMLDEATGKFSDKPGNRSCETPAADRLFVEHLQTTTIHCVQAPTRDQKRIFIAAFSRSDFTKTISSEFVLAFLKIHDRIEHLTPSPTHGTGIKLTDRELECLRWASVGKTSAEIAVITGLSEHTVNHYLNSSCKKLDCLNRTQAVATVLRSGIIS